MVGSVKTNTGHSEATASLFSIVKVLIAMETGIIPANIQYDKPNPEILPLVKGTIKVVAENTPWNGGYAAVNGIGIDSYYGHVLLKSNPKTKKLEKTDDLPRLVVASTRTEEGIKELLNTVVVSPDLKITFEHSFKHKSNAGKMQGLHRSRIHCTYPRSLFQTHTWTFVSRIRGAW